MKIHDTPLQGLRRVETVPRTDSRGSFERLYCEQSLASLHSRLQVSQVNLSITRGRGTLRGMHYQAAPALEAKLIRCLRGRVFDVAVDLRAGSPTFLQWHAVELSGEEPVALFVPEGFAHGFQVLGEEAQLLYFHTAAWNPDCEGGIRHDDPRLAISWPLAARTLSDRDRSHPLIDETFKGLAT